MKTLDKSNATNDKVERLPVLVAGINKNFVWLKNVS